MTDPEIRHEVVDLFLVKWRDERPLTADERVLLDTATPAEFELASRIGVDLGDSARRLVRALHADPESVADEVAFVNMTSEADMTPYIGLPEDAPEMLVLQLIRPWSPRERARAAEITRSWAPSHKQDFEERFAAQCPQGIHWET